MTSNLDFSYPLDALTEAECEKHLVELVRHLEEKGMGLMSLNDHIETTTPTSTC